MKELLHKITKTLFDTAPLEVEAIVGKGRNNQVFKVRINDIIYIFRLHGEVERLQFYKKEKWCAEIVSQSGILTPKITHVGVLDGYAYSVQEYIKGTVGTEADQKYVWFQLGQIARIFHRIPAPKIAINYQEKLQRIFTDDLLTTKAIHPRELTKHIQTRLEESLTWQFTPTLAHGNLHPSNVIVDNNDKVWIVDWETASGNRAPLADLAEIYTWNNGKENIAEFCRGYNLSEDGVSNIMRDIQTLVLLRLMEVLHKKVARTRAGKWKDDPYITEMKKLLPSIGDFSMDIIFTKNL